MSNENTSRFMHMSMGLEGSIRRFEEIRDDEDDDGRSGCRDDYGVEMTSAEVVEFLKSERDKGYVIYPLCHPCECPDFDFYGGGCPGHEVSMEPISDIPTEAAYYWYQRAPFLSPARIVHVFGRPDNLLVQDFDNEPVALKQSFRAHDRWQKVEVPEWSESHESR